ncbi:hypothetical protein ACFL4T_01955 [candidate division KSB1 bacterium]
MANSPLIFTFFGFAVVFLIAFMILFRGSRAALGNEEDKGKRLKNINSKIIITVVMFLMIQNFYLYVNMDWSESPHKKWLFFGLIGFNILIIAFFLIYSFNKKMKDKK